MKNTHNHLYVHSIMVQNGMTHEVWIYFYVLNFNVLYNMSLSCRWPTCCHTSRSIHINKVVSTMRTSFLDNYTDIWDTSGHYSPNAPTFFTAPCMDIVDGTCATPTVIHTAPLQSWLNQGLIGLKSEEKYTMFFSWMHSEIFKNTVSPSTEVWHGWKHNNATKVWIQ